MDKVCHKSALVGVVLAIFAVPAAADAPARIAHADQETGNWLTTGRTYDESRDSPLRQINTGNVQSSAFAWSYDLDTDRGQESTPLAVDGVLYTTSAWSKVQAFDPVSGKLLWQFDPQVPRKTGVKSCCDSVNRGAAYWNGKIYVGTIDGRLIAIDAKTGGQVWSTVTVDQSKSYTIGGAPRIIKGKVIIGNAGADYAVRGYVSAYDAETGKMLWRFSTVPGEPGKKDGAASDAILEKLASKTWSGQWWSGPAAEVAAARCGIRWHTIPISTCSISAPAMPIIGTSCIGRPATKTICSSPRSSR